MRISDWSSDVCSSDLKARLRELLQHRLPSLCCRGRFAFTLRQHPVALFDTLKVAELVVGQIECIEQPGALQLPGRRLFGRGLPHNLVNHTLLPPEQLESA